MIVPKGYTEQQVLDIIEEIVGVLCHSFKFGIYGVEDIKQEGRIMALEAVNSGRYDTSRPLANFLYRHVWNRLVNLRRDKYSRYEPPCLKCPLYAKATKSCTQFEDKMDCNLFRQWQERNERRKMIASPMSIYKEGGEIHDVEYSPVGEEEVEMREIYELIDKKLPVDLRSDYLRMRQKGAGNKVSKFRADQIRAIIQEIIEEYDDPT